MSEVVDSRHKVRNGRIVTTAGIARVNGQYFLGRRKPGGAQGDRWEFPGGKCHRDETDQECLVREFREELGVDVEVHSVLGQVPFQHKGNPYVLVAYEIVLQDTPDTLFEHTEIGWYTVTEMLELDLADSDRKLVEALLKY